MKPTRSLFQKAISMALIALVITLPNLAFATATSLTPVVLKQNNYAVQAADLTITFTSCDNVNGNSFVATGQEILLVQNTDSATHTFTVSSTADNYGRLDTSLTGYTVLVSPGIVGVQMKQLNGWVSTGNTVTLACNSALLKFSVLRYN